MSTSPPRCTVVTAKGWSGAGASTRGSAITSAGIDGTSGYRAVARMAPPSPGGHPGRQAFTGANPLECGRPGGGREVAVVRTVPAELVRSRRVETDRCRGRSPGPAPRPARRRSGARTRPARPGRPARPPVGRRRRAPRSRGRSRREFRGALLEGRLQPVTLGFAHLAEPAVLQPRERADQHEQGRRPEDLQRQPTGAHKGHATNKALGPGPSALGRRVPALAERLRCTGGAGFVPIRIVRRDSIA